MAKKRGKEISLSEKLSSLIQTRPSAVESDDDDLMTVDKISHNENDSEHSAEELDISEFRRRNNELLEENDKKYSGKGISRRDLEDPTEKFSEPEEDEEDSDEDSSVEESNSDQEIDDDVDEEESGSEVEDQSFENDDNDNVGLSKSHEKESFNKEIFVKAASDIEKGKAIKNQLHIWDFLLETRMKFQKCLVASNKFPNHKNFPKFKNKKNSLFRDSVVTCEKSLKHLLNSLLTLQSVLLKSNEEFLSLKKSQGKEFSVENEEISSDSEKDENIESNININNKKLETLNDFSAEISKRHSDFQAYRNTTIQKWNDKTRIGYISNKNFSAFEQSTLKQIQLVLIDKQRLIRRTQTKRSNYHILGEEDTEPPSKKPATESEDSLKISSDDNYKNKGLNKEIFDDDDFYHQLLSEMVKRKANDVTDPVQLGRQWMQLQKIRSKMKKTVDTKASKGRKVRFAVHPKLVNFMMPIDESNYTTESRTEFFNSLFGKTKK